jgi:inorganic pyrophosphatase/exopolyphosphatase
MTLINHINKIFKHQDDKYAMNKRVIITAYECPDLDGTACAIAYKEFLEKKRNNVIVAFFKEPSLEAKFVLEKIGIPKVLDIDKIINLNDSIILVDASEISVMSKKILPEKVIEVIDHRKINESEKFPKARIQIEFVGSAATLIAEKYYKKKVAISKASATLLYSAIVSNTINFKAKVTTDRDKKMAKWLLPQAKISKNFVHEMFVFKSKFHKPLKSVLDDDLATFNLYSHKIGISQLEIINSKKFINNNILKIKKILKELQSKDSLDMIFLTCIDTKKGFNTFVIIDDNVKSLVENCLNVKFSKGVARREGIIMRKEIVPIIKEKLTN